MPSCNTYHLTFNITVIQVYAPTSNTEEAEFERFYEHLQHLLEVKWSEVAQSCLTLCDPVDCSLLNPWDFPGKSTAVGCHFLLQRIFPTQGSNLGLPHCRQTLVTLWATREATPPKNVLFIIGDWNAKVGSQETPGVTGKFRLGIRNEAGQRLIVLPRERTGHSKHPLPTTQEKTLHVDITRLLTLKSDWLYSLQPKMEKLYTVSKNKTGSWLWLRSWTLYCQIQT